MEEIERQGPSALMLEFITFADRRERRDLVNRWADEESAEGRLADAVMRVGCKRNAFRTLLKEVLRERRRKT